MTFAVDFDGTVVTHNYPEVGKNIGNNKENNIGLH